MYGEQVVETNQRFHLRAHGSEEEVGILFVGDKVVVRVIDVRGAYPLLVISRGRPSNLREFAPSTLRISQF